MRRAKQAESERAKKRAKTSDKEEPASDSDSHSDSSDGPVSLIDSDDDKLTTKSSSTAEVVSKDDLARESSSNKASPLPHASLPGANNSTRDLRSLSKANTQVFIQMSGMSTYKETLKELNQQLLQCDLDDTAVVKKLLDKHLERLQNAGNGTCEANGMIMLHRASPSLAMQRRGMPTCYLLTMASTG
jgi:hypothetical protein